MTSFVFYVAAAVVEIGGCFAFWAWLRLGKSVYWVLPGILSRMILAVLLTRVESIISGRTFAAYGGVYIAASLLLLWLIEGQCPDKCDNFGQLFV